MKSCLVLLALIGAVCAGGAFVALNPSVVSRAEHAAQQGAAWASGELAHATAAPAPSATPPAGSVNTAPITLITPSPPAAALPDWTSADCQWAEATMSLDHSLDAAEAQKIATGQDTRYGTSAAVIQEYLTFAADWATALGQIAEVCDGTGIPTAAEQQASIQAFTTAIAGHRADAAARAPDSTLDRLWQHIEAFVEYGNGWDIAWDNEWIGYYQRLTTMFEELPSS
jgi:hypothetical protein